MAALLHDAGKLVLAARAPETLQHILKICAEENCTMEAVEEKLLGVTHAEIGGYLLGVWGLPYPIVEAVANHHNPTRTKASRFDIVGAVYVANVLAKDYLDLVEDPNAPVIDHDYLRSVGVASELPHWVQVARKLARDD